MPDTVADKSLLRARLREGRRQLSETQRQSAARALCHHVVDLPCWSQARRIALYMAGDGEIPTGPLAALCRTAEKQLFLPVMGADRTLSFAAWARDVPLVRNDFGIEEPSADAETVDVAQLDIIFMPLVGWDRQGGRLGMGGGYYDRSLNGVRGPLLVGLAYSLQETSALPRDEWDVPLDFVVTELAAYHCRTAD